MSQKLRNVNTEIDQTPAVPSENTPAEKKPKVVDLYEAIFDALNKSPVSILPEPSFRIASLKTPRGVKVPLKISENGECKEQTIEDVANLIMSYIKTALIGYEKYKFTANQCRECADYWLMASVPIENPPLIAFLKETTLCWKKLDFNLEYGDTPLFDELFSRMSNRNAVKIFIGSMFFPTSHRQQYLWIQGEGGDGKSCLLTIIARLWGSTGSLVQNEAPGKDKHWGVNYIGKRLVYFPDFNDFEAFNDGPLKQIVGSDMINVRPMYAAGYDAPLICKLIFTSNKLPPIDLQKSNRRRIILSKIETTDKDDTFYVDKLWAERAAFFYKCLELYKASCPTFGPILTDDEAKILLADSFDDKNVDMQRLFDFNFAYSNGGVLTPKEISNRLFDRGEKDGKVHSRFKEWLEARGYKAGRGHRGTGPRVIQNLKMLPFLGRSQG